MVTITKGVQRTAKGPCRGGDGVGGMVWGLKTALDDVYVELGHNCE